MRLGAARRGTKGGVWAPRLAMLWQPVCGWKHRLAGTGSHPPCTAPCRTHAVLRHACPAAPLAAPSHPSVCSCMMGDTIAMDQLLAEFIEGQVRIVEGKRAAVPERWFEPAQRPASQAAAPNGDSPHTNSGLPQAEAGQQQTSASSSQARRQVWSDAVDVAQVQQQPERVQAAAAEQAAAGSASFPDRSSGGGAAPGAWSDDMASVLVVDYREPEEAAAAGSSAGAARTAAEPAAAPGLAPWVQSVRGGIVGTSFDLGEAAGSWEADWSSHLSGDDSYTGIRSDADSDSQGSGSAIASVDGGRFESSFSSSHSSDAGQPLSEEALERRLCRMEEQLQHITTLLEGQPPAQQAQQAQQPPAWQSAMFEQQVRGGWRVAGCTLFAHAHLSLPPPHKCCWRVVRLHLLPVSRFVRRLADWSLRYTCLPTVHALLRPPPLLSRLLSLLRPRWRRLCIPRSS